MIIDIFSDIELQVIELMAPGKTADDIAAIVLRDWFNANADRMYKQIKPVEEQMTEIIMAKSTSLDVKSKL